MSNIPSEKRYLLKNGTVLNEKYEIQGILGEGGFGITYIGENRQIGLKTAIKEFFCREYMDRDSRESGEVFLLSEDQKERFQKEKKRFLEEARTLGRFNSEKAIVHVNDFFEENGTCYIVMAFLEGITLKEYVNKNGRMDSRELFEKMKPLLETLARLHESGVIHRDISPDNIMVLDDGSFCLIDFGGAVDYTEKEKSYGALGKRGYAAPEQYRKQEQPGPPADIYALCAAMYFCLTGLEPEDSLQRILLDELQMPKELGIVLPEEIESLLKKGLELRKESRWQSVEEMLDVVSRVYAEKPGQKEERKGRKKILLFSIIAAAAILLAVGGFLIYRANSAEWKLRNVKTQVIRLEADEEMSVQDYNQSAKVIRGRLEAFAGKNNYLFEEEDSVIWMEFPYSCLEGEEPENMCRKFLSRPMELYLVSLESVEVSNKSVKELREEAEAIPREMITGAEKKLGECEGADREAWNLPETGDYYYTQLSLSEEAAKRVNNSFPGALDSAGNQLCLIMDIFQDNFQNYYYLYCTSTGDGRTISVMSENQKGSYPDLLYYDLSHEASADSFGVFAESSVTWEQTDGDAEAGKNQTDPAGITGEYALLEYSFSLAEKEKKAAWYHNMIAFRERLDALDRPYALGSSDYDDTTVVVKIGTEGLYKEELDLLGASYNSLETASIWQLSFSGCSLYTDELVLDEDNRLVFSLSSSEQEDMLEDLESLEKAGVDTCYLLCEPSRFSIASAKVSELIAEVRQGRAVFPDLSFDPESGFLDFADVCLAETMEDHAYLDKITVYNEAKRPLFVPFEAFPSLCSCPVPDQTEFLQQLEQETEERGGRLSYTRELSGEYWVRFWFFDIAPENLATDLLSFLEETAKKHEKELDTGAFYSWTVYFSTESFPDPDRIRLYTDIGKTDDEQRMVLNDTLRNTTAVDNKILEEDANAYLQGSPVLKSLLPQDVEHLTVQ